MKKLLCLLILIGYSVVGFGQQDSVFTIEGTVWDEQTGDGLENATIFLIKDEIKIDSTFSNENGFYKFEISETGCYHLRTGFDKYFSVSTDKPYCVDDFQHLRFQHDFYLQTYIIEKSYDDYLIPPVIDTILIQVFVKNKDDKPINNIVLKAFYENEDTVIFNIKNGEIILDYVRGKTLYLEIGKDVKSFFFPPEMSCGMPYIQNPITNEQYDAHVASRYTIGEFQKIYFNLKKE